MVPNPAFERSAVGKRPLKDTLQRHNSKERVNRIISPTHLKGTSSLVIVLNEIIPRCLKIVEDPYQKENLRHYIT